MSHTHRGASKLPQSCILLTLFVLCVMLGLPTVASACTPGITPELQVNAGAWQNTNTVTVTSGETVTLSPHPVTGGSWSWTGPNGFTAKTRKISDIKLSTGANSYVATYDNTSSCKSTETFTITVGGGGSGCTGTCTVLPSVYITLYGWYDNSPPGAGIAYAESAGYPTIHNVATVGGTYANPSTFATAAISSQDPVKGEMKVGQKIWVPAFSKYFILEDECSGSGPDPGNCESDWSPHKIYHVDLYLGGTPGSLSSDNNCEDNLTIGSADYSNNTVSGGGPVWEDPPSGLTVSTAALYTGSSSSDCWPNTPGTH